MADNHQLRLRRRPEGIPSDADFEPTCEPVPAADALADGQVLLRNLYLSIDPTIRGWIDRDTYLPAVKLGDVVRSAGAGEVIASRNDKYKVGDKLLGLVGWQEYALVDGRGAQLNPIPPGLPLEAALGVFGVTGLTAYFGLTDIGKPRAGETVVVSGAAGATGSIVAQIAKVLGCRAVGIAGGREKCDYVVKELGFDACIDYRQHADAKSLYQALKSETPDGVHGHFENVGGNVLDAVLARMNAFGRIALCGMISGYEGAPIPLQNPSLILTSRLRVEGFIVSEHLDVWPQALAELGARVGDGSLKYRETIAEGIEAAPEAFLGMLKGKNFGKQLVKLI